MKRSCRGVGYEGLGVSKTAPRTIDFADSAVEAGRSANAAFTGCPWQVKSMLRDVGLRPTRQRIALGQMLFGKGDLHTTAEILYE